MAVHFILLRTKTLGARRTLMKKIQGVRTINQSAQGSRAQVNASPELIHIN